LKPLSFRDSITCFQTAKTGVPAEYAEIEETMSPVALEMVAGWILSTGVAAR
jgi:hypothetical protein